MMRATADWAARAVAAVSGRAHEGPPAELGRARGHGLPAEEGACVGARPSDGQAERCQCHRFRGMEFHLGVAGLVRAGGQSPIPGDAGGAHQKKEMAQDPL